MMASKSTGLPWGLNKRGQVIGDLQGKPVLVAQMITVIRHDSPVLGLQAPPVDMEQTRANGRLVMRARNLIEALDEVRMRTKGLAARLPGEVAEALNEIVALCEREIREATYTPKANVITMEPPAADEGDAGQ